MEHITVKFGWYVLVDGIGELEIFLFGTVNDDVEAVADERVKFLFVFDDFKAPGFNLGDVQDVVDG